MLAGLRAADRLPSRAARREAREGRNPSAGAPVRVAVSTAVRLKPGKGLKDAVNGGA